LSTSWLPSHTDPQNVQEQHHLGFHLLPLGIVASVMYYVYEGVDDERTWEESTKPIPILKCS